MRGSTLIAVTMLRPLFSLVSFGTQSGFAFRFALLALQPRANSLKTDYGATCLYHFIVTISTRFVNDFLAKKYFFAVIFFKKGFYPLFRFPKTVHLPSSA